MTNDLRGIASARVKRVKKWNNHPHAVASVDSLLVKLKHYRELTAAVLVTTIMPRQLPSDSVYRNELWGHSPDLAPDSSFSAVLQS